MDSVFESTARKLARVPEHIKAIQSCVDAYSARYPSKLVSNPQGTTNLDIPIPDTIDISILVGEAIYEMRSALDHLAFRLVQLNAKTIQLPLNWDEKCQFPIRTKPLKVGQVPPLAYGSFENLPGISVQAHAIIEGMQPYYGVGKINNSLRHLSELSNIDKHRHLAVTRSSNQISVRRTSARGFTSSATWAADNGAEVDLLDGDDRNTTVEMDVALATFVRFDEPILKDACTLSVQELLEIMLGAIKGGIIPAFANLINNP